MLNEKSKNERDRARQADGKFGKQHHSVPEASLVSSPGILRAALPLELAMLADTEDRNWTRLVDCSAAYLDSAMPLAAEIVEYETSDDGPWLEVFDAYDSDGDDLEAGAVDHVNAVLRILGVPGEDYDETAFTRPEGGYGWERDEPGDAEAAAIAEAEYRCALQEWRGACDELRIRVRREMREALPRTRVLLLGWSRACSSRLEILAICDGDGRVQLVEGRYGAFPELVRANAALALLRYPESLSEFVFDGEGATCELLL